MAAHVVGASITAVASRTEAKSAERASQLNTVSVSYEQLPAGADIVIVAIAAQFARVALTEFKGLIPETALVVSLMKGIERTTGKRMDEVVMETLDLPAERFAAISGPNLSKQIADRQKALQDAVTDEADKARLAAIADRRTAYIAVRDAVFAQMQAGDAAGRGQLGGVHQVVAQQRLQPPGRDLAGQQRGRLQHQPCAGHGGLAQRDTIIAGQARFPVHLFAVGQLPAMAAAPGQVAQAVMPGQIPRGARRATPAQIGRCRAQAHRVRRQRPRHHFL